MAEPTIKLPIVVSLIQDLMDATNAYAGDGAPVSECWEKLQDTLAPCPPPGKPDPGWRGDPGRVGTTIIGSDLNDETKRALVKLLREMTIPGPFGFCGPYSAGAELLKATLAVVSPK